MHGRRHEPVHVGRLRADRRLAEPQPGVRRAAQRDNTNDLQPGNNSPFRFPNSFKGVPLFYEWSRDYIKELLDGGHAGAANLSAVFVASYTDPGEGDTPGLTGRDDVRIVPSASPTPTPTPPAP
jgi:hypothetical protein